MRFNSNLLSLPASILLLVISQTSAQQESQDGHLSESHPREIEDIERNPVGVMKMSLDDGEKFFPEYWQYGDAPDVTAKLKVLAPKAEDSGLLANLSMPFTSPLGLHTYREAHYDDMKAKRLLEGRNTAAALAMLEKRDFVCPTGYNSCIGIGYQYSCCSTGETCFPILDTGLGPVGCCANGYTCGGTINTCGSVNTPCASELGGGCCLPGFVCAGVGCVMNPTVVTTTITQVFTISIIASSTQLTTIVTISTLTQTPTTSSTASSIISTSSLQPTSTTTTTSTISTTPSTGTSSGTGIIPVRPTSRSSSTTSLPTTSTETSCPTGFYGCSAYYQGGCCRTGRDCNTTSCPPQSSTTIINSGVTVVVPVGSAATVTSLTGACATGWSSCAASVGGDCCLSGWTCGTASCESVGASETAVQQKASPNGAGCNGLGMRGALVIGAVGVFWVGVGMVLL